VGQDAILVITRIFAYEGMHFFVAFEGMHFFVAFEGMHFFVAFEGMHFFVAERRFDPRPAFQRRLSRRKFTQSRSDG